LSIISTVSTAIRSRPYSPLDLSTQHASEGVVARQVMDSALCYPGLPPAKFLTEKTPTTVWMYWE
jgi:hypothetical protein